MRNVVIVGLALGLGACSTLSGFGGIDPATIAAIQNDAALACSLVPTADTVANLIKANDPKLQTAEAIAAAICAALTAAPTAHGFISAPRPIPTIDGVPILVIPGAK